MTLVPALAARQLPPGVCLVPPAEPVTRQVFTVSRRGGDRKPAVRVVLDALSAAALSAAGRACPPRLGPPRLRLSQNFAVRDEEPGVLAVRPAQPGPGQALEIVPGGQPVLDGPVAERRFRQPFGP